MLLKNDGFDNIVDIIGIDTEIKSEIKDSA